MEKDSRDDGKGKEKRRAPSNPLLAEALRQARQRQTSVTAAVDEQGLGDQSNPQFSGPAWRLVTDVTAVGTSCNDGNYHKTACSSDILQTGQDKYASVSAPSTSKRKHSPIIWQARAGKNTVQTEDGAISDAAHPWAGDPISRALAEVAAFDSAQAAGVNEVPGDALNESLPLKPSPSSSEPEDVEGGKKRWPDNTSTHLENVQVTSRWPDISTEHVSPSGQLPLSRNGGLSLQGTHSNSTRDGAANIGDIADEVERHGQLMESQTLDMLRDCRSVDLYEKINRISEGTYGVVYRAQNKQTGELCALKKVKLDKERDGFPLTSIREINILLSLHHPNIVNVAEVVVGTSLDAVFLVMECADHDLKGLMDSRMTQRFSIAEVKSLMLQLLSGVSHLHDNWVLHRDLKTSNILYTNRGELKICDFGLARQYGSPLKAYTHMVVTLWYRAPELLLGAQQYSTAVDVWSVGCIMGELLLKEPLFSGKGELDQLDRIFRILGAPTESNWPGITLLPGARKFVFQQGKGSGLRSYFPPAGVVFDGRPTLSDCGLDLLMQLLSLCPETRISAAEALQHPWFREMPYPTDNALMPTFRATNTSAYE